MFFQVLFLKFLWFDNLHISPAAHKMCLNHKDILPLATSSQKAKQFESEKVTNPWPQIAISLQSTDI